MAPIFYRTVVAHLTARGLQPAAAWARVYSKDWRVVLRLHNLIARRRIIERHNYCVAVDGAVYVGNSASCSSLVRL